MAKAAIMRDVDGLFYGLKILCPGCLYQDGTPSPHVMHVDWLPPGETESPHAAGKPHWTFNGDLDRPVFGPSLLCTWEIPAAAGDPEAIAECKRRAAEDPDYRWPMKPQCCHSFIGCNGAQPGQITFLGDCTHKLAGQTVDLPDVKA